MKHLIDRVAKAGVHAVLGNRSWVEARLAEYAANGIDRSSGPGNVLEIGSGKPVDGEFVYSMRHVFPHDDVRMSDIVSDFGHEVIDVTTMDFDAEFDAICLLYTSPSPRDRTRSRMPSSA